MPLLAVLLTAGQCRNAADAPLGATCNAGTVAQAVSPLSATTSSPSRRVGHPQFAGDDSERAIRAVLACPIPCILMYDKILVILRKRQSDQMPALD